MPPRHMTESFSLPVSEIYRSIAKLQVTGGGIVIFSTQDVLDFYWDILDLLAPRSPMEHGQLKTNMNHAY